MADITIVNGVYKATNITGGHHPVWYVWYVNHILPLMRELEPCYGYEMVGDGPFRVAEVMKEMTRIQVVFAERSSVSCIIVTLIYPIPDFCHFRIHPIPRVAQCCPFPCRSHLLP